MSNKYTSVYDWLKYIKANVVGINLRELRIITILIGYRLIHKCITHERIKRLMNPAQATSFRNATGKIDYTMTNDYMFRAVLQDCYPQSDRTWQGS